jgi:diaminopimelate epimerase
MQTFLKFVKMHALGNDFLIIDRLTQSFYIDQVAIKALGNRKTGVGFDQLLVLEPPLDVDHDFSYQIYNCNGSQAKQCLNGVRCLAHYVNDHGLIKKRSVKFQTGEYSVHCEILSGTVAKTSLMLQDNSVCYQESLNILSTPVDRVLVGNEHIICWDVQREERAKTLAELKNQGVTFDRYNISFVHKQAAVLILDTFERGVGKTMSCGSAAVAAFLAYTHRIEQINTLRIETQLGYVTVNQDHEWLSLIGPVTRVFSGELLLRYH